MMRSVIASTILLLTLTVGVATLAPMQSFAAEEDPSAKCKGKKDGTPVEAQGGRVKGTCQKEQFKAESSDGKAIDAGLQALMQALQGMLGKLGGGGGGGSGSGAGGAPGGERGANPLGDTTNSILNNLLGRNGTNSPLAPESTTRDILDSAFDSDADPRNTTILNPDGTVRDNTSGVDTEITAVLDEGDTATGSSTTITTQRGTENIPTPTGESVVNTNDGTRTVNGQQVGVTQNGSGIEARSRENNGNTEVAGFYGGTGATGGGVQGAVSRVCTSRPWATNFLSRLIRPSFFDNLCVRLGFSVTAPEAVRPSAPVDTTKAQRAVEERVQRNNATTTTVGTLRGPGITCTPGIVRAGKEAVLDFSCGSAKLTAVAGFTAPNSTISSATVKPTADTKYGVQCSDSTVYTCTVQVVNPRLTIWTEPKEVTLGARSTVYWTATDVFADTCFVKGPSFLERGARGGAATVPINDPSKFTLTCLAEDGATTTASVTVELDL